MKSSQALKKQTSQMDHMDMNPIGGTMSDLKKSQSHIKIAKPRPAGTETSSQGPRDCFPLG